MDPYLLNRLIPLALLAGLLCQSRLPQVRAANITQEVAKLDMKVVEGSSDEAFKGYEAILQRIHVETDLSLSIRLRMAKVKCYQEDFASASEILDSIVASFASDHSSLGGGPAWLYAGVMAEWAKARMEVWRGDFLSAVVHYENGERLLKKNSRLLNPVARSMAQSLPSEGYSADSRLSLPACESVREFLKAWSAQNIAAMRQRADSSAGTIVDLISRTPEMRGIPPVPCVKLLGFSHFHAPANPGPTVYGGRIAWVDVDISTESRSGPPLDSGRKRFIVREAEEGPWIIVAFYSIPRILVYNTPLPWYLD